MTTETMTLPEIANDIDAMCVCRHCDEWVTGIRAQLAKESGGGEAVAHCLLRKNGEGEWINDAKSWTNGLPSPGLVKDVGKYPDRYCINYAYAAPPMQGNYTGLRARLMGLVAEAWFKGKDEAALGEEVDSICAELSSQPKGEPASPVEAAVKPVPVWHPPGAPCLEPMLTMSYGDRAIAIPYTLVSLIPGWLSIGAEGSSVWRNHLGLVNLVSGFEGFARDMGRANLAHRTAQPVEAVGDTRYGMMSGTDIQRDEAIAHMADTFMRVIYDHPDSAGAIPPWPDRVCAGIDAIFPALAHPRPTGAVALVSVAHNGDPIFQTIEGWRQLSPGNHLLYAASTGEQAGEVVPDPKLLAFYGVDGWAGLVEAQQEHVLKLQDAARRNVKPWDDTFPPTLLPKYLRDAGLIDADEVGAYLVTAPSIGYWSSVRKGIAAQSIAENHREAGVADTSIVRLYAAQPRPVGVPDATVKLAAIECARRAYGYWKGDSTDGDSAMRYFDGNMGLAGIAHNIDMMESAIRKHIDAAPAPAKAGEA